MEINVKNDEGVVEVYSQIGMLKYAFVEERGLVLLPESVSQEERLKDLLNEHDKVDDVISHHGITEIEKSLPIQRQ